MTDVSPVTPSNVNYTLHSSIGPSISRNTFDEMVGTHGAEVMANVATQSFVGKVISFLGDMLNGADDVPQLIKEQSYAVMDTVERSLSESCPCTPDVAADFADSPQAEVIEQTAAEIAEAVAENSNESVGGSNANDAVTAAISNNQNLEDDEDKEDGVGGGTSWFEVLASNLADVQAVFLNKALAASKVMQGEAANAAGETTTPDAEGAQTATPTNATPSTAFLKAQSEFTANMQLFNLFANQSATALKTIGEGLTGIARKQ